MESGRLARVLPNSSVSDVTRTAGIAILSAMINGEGDELETEWVSIGNFTSQDLDLSGWHLNDTNHSPLPLSGVLEPGETLRVANMYNPGTGIGVQLNNRRGTLELVNPAGAVVDRVGWSVSKTPIVEGVPVEFHAAQSNLPPLRVIAALVNAAGDERKNEWVTIYNFGKDEIDLAGWALSDNTYRKPWPLEGKLLPGESKRFKAMHTTDTGPSVQLGNRRGTIVLIDPTGKEADKVSYQGEKKFKQGEPLTFLLDGDVAKDGMGDQV